MLKLLLATLKWQKRGIAQTLDRHNSDHSEQSIIYSINKSLFFTFRNIYFQKINKKNRKIKNSSAAGRTRGPFTSVELQHKDPTQAKLVANERRATDINYI